MYRPLILLTLMVVAPVGAASASTSLLPPRVERAITDRIAGGEYPALVVAVVDGDRSQIAAFGKLDDGRTPDADTIFQIGSVTKTFTATLLAEAVNDGSVGLDTPVSKLLPGFTIPARDGKPITLGELAIQDSGLPRLPSNLAPANAADPYADYDAAKLESFLGTYKLPRDPGASYEYSNLGVGLLGYALAQRAGMSYAALVQARILKPLGMASSSATLSEPLDVHWAKGHDGDGKPVEPWHLGVLAGAGAINSTGADMLRYLQANMGRGADPLRDAMRFAHAPRSDLGNNERIGLVWMTRHDKQGDLVWHNGETGGYASFVGMTADGRRGVVILTNIASDVSDLGFATLLPDAPLAPAQQAIEMTGNQLDAYVGAYQLAPGFVLTVFRKQDQLLAQATGQGAFPIYPSATDAFFARVADIRIDFQRGADGSVQSLVLHQNGANQTAVRIP